MARTNLDLKTVRNPVKLSRAQAIKAKFDDMDQALDAACLHEYLGTPSLADDDRFLLSVVMQATAYTLDETTLPAGNPPRNVVITHTTDTTTDTLGDATVTGTDVNDEEITETITLVADSAVKGTKAFKTVTSVITPDWVQAGGVSDLIEVGFDTLLGLSRALAATTDVVQTMLDGAVVKPDAVAVDASVVSKNTVDMATGTYDGTKVARALVVV